jgi:hypothetical protein
MPTKPPHVKARPMPPQAATRPETHAAAPGPWRTPSPVLLADNAATASQAMPCAGCSYAILPGQRAARLTDGTDRWVHVAGCASTAARTRA